MSSKTVKIDVFSVLQQIANDGSEVMSSGSLFHILGLAGQFGPSQPHPLGLKGIVNLKDTFLP